MTDQVLGNGLLQQSCYNANTLRLTSLRVYPGALQTCVGTPSSPRLNLSYSYQNNGNVSQIVDATRSETLNYTYDELDRVKEASGPSAYAQNYSYNSIGNLTNKQYTIPSNPSAANLVAWWSLDEASGTRYDSYAYNHLADNNTVAATTGKQGSAGNFVRANQEWLSISDSPAVSTGDVDYTLTGWVKLSSKTGYMTILSKYGTTWPGSMEYSLQWNPDQDRFLFLIGNGVIANSVAATSAGSPQVGTWYFVVAWHNAATNEIGISVNDVANTATTTIAPQDSTSALKIGNGGVNELWDGAIDEVLFYKRVLTATERTWLYNNGLGRGYTELNLAPANPGTTNLISWWTLNQASGTRTDSHTSGNTLTDNNTVTSTTGMQGIAASHAQASQEWLSRSDNASLSTGDIDYTLAGWVYLSSKSATMTIASKYGTTYPCVPGIYPGVAPNL